jgi:menaquinone-9 beta-reductase
VTTADALVIGGGPAGSSAATWLSAAGWKVVLVESKSFPRQKVCGECLPAGAFCLLDELGVGDQVRQLAGPELRFVGWMQSLATQVSPMPAGLEPRQRYGRAIGRDVLDTLLMERVRAVGVDVLQPARVVRVGGSPGNFQCDIAQDGSTRSIEAAVVLDAHGSWEKGPRIAVPDATPDPADRPAQATDLLAFKATFAGTTLAPGLLPVIALPGGYGGMVVSNDARTTVALCLRRDALRALRRTHPGVPAGLAVERYLMEHCRGAADALRDSERQGAWLAAGPLRPGFRRAGPMGIYRIGNAGAEVHPLVGEGIRMALQSSRALTRALQIDPSRAGRFTTGRWRAACTPRAILAAGYAHMAMRPHLAAPVSRILQQWPGLLGNAAALAGKARSPAPTDDAKEHP